MDEVLKKLLSEKVLTEETAAAVKGAFQTALNEAKAAQEATIRADLAAQYAKDKEAMYEAFGKFLEQELKEHVAELKEGIEEVDKMKLEYAQKASKLKETAQKFVKNRLGAMEQAIEMMVRKEIAEIHESEVANRRAYLNAINEKTAELESEKVKFRKKAALVLENIINVRVANIMEELRDDIVAARQSDFGRELYEAFCMTFRRQFFDSSSEFRNLVKRLKEAEDKAAKIKSAAVKKVTEAEQRAKVAETARKKVEESVVRQRKIAKLLENLTGKSRTQMKSLLESVKTDQLDSTFRKYISDVMKESKSTKAPKVDKLEEAVVELKTGGNEIVLTEDEEDDDIVEIRRRAHG